MAYGEDLPKVPNANELTYGTYLKVPELLNLQKPVSDPAHHDEMLFIVIHQAYEVWFKLILHELENSIHYMESGKVLRAQHFLKRVNEIFRVLVPQIHILETMTPFEFLGFRERLNPASGFQSAQFREVEFIAGAKDPRYLKFFVNQPHELSKLEKRMKGKDLRGAFYDLLSKLGYEVPKGIDSAESEERNRDAILKALVKIYQNPEAELPIYLLSEALVDLDANLGLWREHHVRVVERIIGNKQGTGGSSGVNYLKQTTQKKCFPLLWEVRTCLTRSAPV